MSAFDTTTHLGAFLARERHFRPNGLIGFMSFDELPVVIEAYADASGKHKTISDRILTVNGCLATCDDWKAFDLEWQPYLACEGFVPAPRIKPSRYVFHASQFWADKCPYMPDKLKGNDTEKRRVYSDLVDIICTHRKAVFGYGVLLADFIRYEKDVPYINRIIGRPATLLSHLCIRWNSQWAERIGADPCVGYTFDQGDDFRQLRHQFEEVVRKAESVTASGVRLEDKVRYSPLQAADIVTWECKKYWQDKFINPVLSLVPQLRPSRELTKLIGDFHPTTENLIRLYGYDDIKYEVENLWREIIKLTPEKEAEVIGAGKTFESMQDHMKLALEYDHQQRSEEQKAKREAKQAKKASKLYEQKEE